jgi:hypothetical protein
MRGWPARYGELAFELANAADADDTLAVVFDCGERPAWRFDPPRRALDLQAGQDRRGRLDIGGF